MRPSFNIAVSQMIKICVFAALLACAAALKIDGRLSPDAEAVGITYNRITSLPGYGTTKELSYSGYLSVDPTGRGSLENGLFYWLFYSRGVPFKDPLGTYYLPKLSLGIKNTLSGLVQTVFYVFLASNLCK
jgi:hypothetical protein